MNLEPVEFELGGVVFGGRGRNRILVRDFSLPGAELTTNDTTSPGGPGLILGRDRAGGQVATFSLFTHAFTEADARELERALAAVWQREFAVLESVPLIVRVGGQVFVLFGRPRRWVPPRPTVAMARGRADISCDFQVSDPLVYAGTESSLDLTLVAASSHGLVFPATPPFAWASMVGEPLVRQIVVGGDAPTPLLVTFRGPVSRPWLRVGDVTVQATGDLAYDESLVVDARAGRIARGDGAAWPGMLSPATRLGDLRLAPGVHEVQFGGVDVTGTATATVSWRDAWRSL